jgi:C-terminal processing protease CtpA/Prc
MTFPSREYRLLALFRFWNVIDLFYPYKALLDQPWADVLPRFIPLFDANSDAAAYQQTVRELVATVQDSHGYVSGATTVPRWYPPFRVRFLEGQTVVDFKMKEARGLRLWDSILAVDGQPIADYRRARSSTIAAATPQSLELKLHDVMLRGEKGSRVRLSVRGLDGKTREVSVVRSVAANDSRWEEIGTGLPKRPVYEVLPGRIGYADLRRLEVAQVDAMFEAVSDTDAVIFDMRGYPRGTAWEIAPRLTERKDVVGALFSRPLRDATDFGNEEGTFEPRYTFEQTIPPRRGSVYRGRVVVLIDASAISQAEHSCLFYEAAAPVTFIGMPTAGTNGDVTNLVLPGNLVVGFTGHDVRHADGRQLQRIGIQPAIRVEPTIRGYAEGRDEILEAAVEFLKK